MARHPAFIPRSPLNNGFDVVEAEGTTYLRLIVDGFPKYAVPQTAADLRKLAADLLNSADVVDQVEAGRG